jgi:hypothetical protein
MLDPAAAAVAEATKTIPDLNPKMKLSNSVVSLLRCTKRKGKNKID